MTPVVSAPPPGNCTALVESPESPAPPSKEDAEIARAQRMRAGTLQYTTSTLVWLFVWLLWGDFVVTLMEAVVPSILPLRLKELQTPDWALPLILSTIPTTINFILNPIVSTASDRYRSRLGRRIPFLLFSTPVVSLALVLMAFAPEFGGTLHRLFGPATGFSLGVFLILTLGLLFAIFKISDVFLNTVFWYFFRDVVPFAYMARFLGLFRTVGALAGMLYNLFVYKHALSHTRWIFLAAAAVYFSGFLMMCLFVREGEYPPAKAISKNPLRAFRTYVSECLRHRIYYYFFLQHLFWIASHAAGVFFVFLKLSLGLTLAQIGMLSALSSGVHVFVNYPAGILADRYHPMRVLIWMKLGLVAIVPLNFIWLFGNFTPQTAFAIFIFLFAVELPLGTLYAAVLLPMSMRLLPQGRFGQFCSFSAALTALGGICTSLVVGFFMTYMRRLFPDEIYGKDYCYRLFPVWRIPLLLISLSFLFLLYREWKRLGGEKSYHPPGFDDELLPPVPVLAPIPVTTAAAATAEDAED